MKKLFITATAMAFLPLLGLWITGRLLEALDEALVPDLDFTDQDWTDWLGEDDYE